MVDAREAVELEVGDVVAVADRADDGVQLAARHMCLRADMLHLAYDRLDLVGRGGLFHDDHHLDLILSSYGWRFLTTGSVRAPGTKRPSASW